MKMTKVEMLTTSANVALDEAVEAANDRAAPDFLSMVPAAPSGASVDEKGQLNGDTTLKEQTRLNVLAVIAERDATAKSPERKAYLLCMRELVEKEGTLPRSGHKFHLRATLNLAGVTFDDWMKQAALRQDVERIAPLLPLDDTQSTIHVRGGPRADSIVARARKVMDEMQANNEKVMRESLRSKRPSHRWFAKRMGVPYSLIFGSSMVKKELHARVADGRLLVGPPFIDPLAPTRAEKKVVREKLKQLVLGYVKAGRPIPASSERSTRIDIDLLLDECEIVDERMRECMKCDPMFRHELATVIRKVKLKPVHLSRIDARVVTYNRLREEGDTLLRQIYRSDNSRGQPGSESENNWVANQRSLLSRAMKAAERIGDDDAAKDFIDPEFKALLAQGRTASAKGNTAYDRAILIWTSVLKGLQQATNLPASFAGALDALMVAEERTAPSLADAIGCKKGLLHAWRRGASMPTFQNVHFVAKLETELKAVPGTLSKRLPNIRNSHTLSAGRKEVTTSDGRVLQLAGLWRYMHPDAPTWPEDRLREHAEQAHKRVFGVNTVHRVRQRAAMSNAYNLPEPDPVSPIWKELEDLVKFQTGALDDGRLRHPQSEWNTEGTIKLHRQQVTTLVRWLMLSIDQGGAGIAPSLITFSLLLNHRLVIRYICWRIMRAADLDLDGAPIGARITSTEKDLMFFFARLLDPQFGWVTQSRHIMMPPQVIGHKLRIPLIRSSKTGLIVDDENGDDIAAMPMELVDRCSSEDGWKAAAATAAAHIRSTGARLAKSHKLIRNPQELVMPILRHQQPIAVGLRMVRDALQNLPPFETAPYRHATEVQRCLAFTLLLLVVFRSANMRSLTWRADGTGDIRKMIDGYEVIVGADRFKNGFSPELFGPSWNRRDYERTLGNWGQLNELMDHFLGKCRSILLNGRESDLLFPPPKGRDAWTEHNFNYLIMSFTRKWCVWNPRYGTGMHGVRPFGPHPARNIVATHIIRNHPTEDRWRLASLVLQTGIDKVKLRYGWLTSREELAKADYLFDQASTLALSNADLY